MKMLTDLAQVIRSKNAGPFVLTLDIIFKKKQDYEQIKTKKMINCQKIASLYKIPLDFVTAVIFFDPAKAVKIIMPRQVVSGSAGDTDVYGTQQHAPLLKMKLNLKG